LCAALFGLALCALAAIFLSAVDWRGQLLCALLLLAHLGLLLHRHRQQSGYLIWRASGWLWIDRQGEECVLDLQSTSVWPSLIVLRFRTAKTGKVCTFTLLRDSLAVDAQRRLRIYLRHMPVFVDISADMGVPVGAAAKR
jgi:hypothetical protein